MTCPAVVSFSCFVAPMLALGAIRGRGGGLGLAEDGVSLTEGVSLGRGGLGAGTGTEVPDGRVSVLGFGVTGGFSVVLQGWGNRAEPDSRVKDDVGSLAVSEVSVIFKFSELHGFTAIKPLSSQNSLVDGLGACDRILGLGATVGGTDLACCP